MLLHLILAFFLSIFLFSQKLNRKPAREFQPNILKRRQKDDPGATAGDSAGLPPAVNAPTTDGGKRTY